jgi:hypothetical protein
MLGYPLLKLWRRIESHYHPQELAVEPEDECPVRSAQPDRTFGNSFEHRVKIERRAADNFEHISGHRLLLQRLFKLVEQPRVLDGDDRLSGKVLNRSDLFVGKRTNFLAVNGEHTNQLALL